MDRMSSELLDLANDLLVDALKESMSGHSPSFYVGLARRARFAALALRGFQENGDLLGPLPESAIAKAKGECR